MDLYDTVAYYDSQENEYIAKTINADMSQAYFRFQKYLPDKAAILDAGCGSGRDSLYFIKSGYTVTAMDASKVMCDVASKHIKQPVLQMKFNEITYNRCFNGVWACASLLHVPEVELSDILQRLFASLYSGGILYASWKYGTQECIEVDSGRFFCDMDEIRINKILSVLSNVCLRECWLSNDVRSSQNKQIWINLIIEKLS